MAMVNAHCTRVERCSHECIFRAQELFSVYKLCSTFRLTLKKWVHRNVQVSIENYVVRISLRQRGRAGKALAMLQ